MNPRERMMAMGLGGALGLFVLYQSVNFVFIKPLVTAKAELEDLEKENDRLDGVLRSRRNLSQRWLEVAGRTLSFERAEATNRFGQNIKEIGKRHGFDKDIYTPASGSKIGNKTGIATIAYRVVGQGPYPQALAFLHELYRTPYICAISKLSISPQIMKGLAPDEVKFEVTIESPLLPKIDRSKIQEVAAATSMPAEALVSAEPFREDMPPLEDFGLLTKRNIFKPYIPPPLNVLVIDNQDWKTAAVRMQFLWEDKPSDQVVEAVPGRSQKSVTGKGGIVEISGSYADGTSFGPERLDFTKKKDWTYIVKTHSPEPAPDEIDLQVTNQDKIAATVEVVLTQADGTTKKYPPMQIPAGATLDIDRFRVKSLTASGKYASGKVVAPQTFTPAKGKQTYTVPLEPVETVATPIDTSDPPADAQYTVTGLLTYRDQQEMLVMGASPPRVVIPIGEEGAVDGGVLRGIHPLGGVVKMPSGNYYLYPLGRKYTDRVKLDVKREADLPAAIDQWIKSAPPPASTAVAEAPAAAIPNSSAMPRQSIGQRPNMPPTPRTPVPRTPPRPAPNGQVPTQPIKR